MLVEKNATLIMIGDSVTDCGRSHPDGEGISGSNAWGNGYVDLVRGYLTAFYTEYQIRVINKGTSGHQSKDLVARWHQDVLAYRPQWVSIMIGINDVWRHFDAMKLTHLHGDVEEYEKNMIQMIEETLPITRNIVIMTPYMIETNKEDAMRKMMDQYGRVCERLANYYQLKFIDLQAEFDKVLQNIHPMEICWDRVHPNMIGHTLIAHSFLKSIDAK